MEKTVKNKVKKMQLKWKRYDAISTDFKVVRQKEGGGHRFWEFDSDVPILFSEVKHKAIALYFDVNGFNNFGEDYSETLCIDTKYLAMNLMIMRTLWDYLDTKGIIYKRLSSYFFQSHLTNITLIQVWIFCCILRKFFHDE